MSKVYLVGAGPGDPDLLTIKGLKAIQASDVILYDRLVNETLLDYAPSHCEKIYCGKQPEHHTLHQETINILLCKHASQGKTVTRLKGGDPFIFGRGGEEAEALSRQGIPFEVIPGITSGAAAPAYAGIPLTHRNISSSVTFVSGVTPQQENDENYWERLAHHVETLCIYMGVKKLPYILERLITGGLNPQTPIALIHWGTTMHQQTVTGTLATITDKLDRVKNPSMIVIGEVVRLREQLQWFENLHSSQSTNTQVI
ncbi:uroporphyrin-III C-methyltransferase [Pullulanibacillus pueri]|uniref:Uroporphyrinogen-III C-methyltransferase n=1 Tax=Pullulanibacillus pueri TaxID=1437324 RepID=A0A8J3A245_9BACL|nr:uroporphyrinogen-III C-methyltransferase [Pullulanibacillus pueri]MBM7684037.1 uroporphyrin-III C-methyltransferase [Pullulanibacillus pueri]GGH88495.1 uroporphyrin-III C-methyltransferase [Pullulanibacillus pueri]